MRFNCHGCERTVLVRGEPPPGKRVQVTCPSCGAANRLRAPAQDALSDLSDAQRRFMDFIRRYSEGKR
jgi:RNase P subunit RPR2